MKKAPKYRFIAESDHYSVNELVFNKSRLMHLCRTARYAQERHVENQFQLYRKMVLGYELASYSHMKVTIEHL